MSPQNKKQHAARGQFPNLVPIAQAVTVVCASMGTNAVFADACTTVGTSIIAASTGTSCVLGNDGGLDLSVTVNNGVILGTSSSTTGVLVISGFAAGSIINNGTILGSSDSTGYGIFLGTSSSLSGGIINNSTIMGAATSNVSGAAGYGIFLDSNASISSGILNNGTILGLASSPTSNVAAYGIFLSSGSSISGGITNNGTIQGNASTNSSSGLGFGIFAGSATISGGITNNAGAFILGSGYGTSGSGGVGIFLQSSTLNGGITNSGTIKGCSSGTSCSGTYTGFGIQAVSSSVINGGITNSAGGLIEGTGYEGGYGIFLDNSIINDGIVNSGTIHGSSTTGSNNGGHGIHLQSGSLNSGGILNNLGGMITGSGNSGSNGSNGWGISLSSSSITGGITNHGIIKGFAGGNRGFGISFNGGISTTTGSGTMFTNLALSGGITNSGTIKGTGGSNGAGLFLSNATILGGVSNNTGGLIQGTGSSSGGKGISLDAGSSIVGGITNSGTIKGTGLRGAAGIFIQSSSDISGGITNNAGGIIQAIESTTSGGPTAAGIWIATANVSGGINNSGTIEGINDTGSGFGIGVFLSGSAMTGAISNNTGGIIRGRNFASAAGTVGSSAAGIWLSGSDIVGGVNNSGTIIGSQTSMGIGYGIISTVGSDISGGITNNAGGIIQGVGVSATGYGIAIKTTSDISGGIINSGTIKGTGSGSGAGIFVKTLSNISGGITNNSGGIISGSTFGINLQSPASAISVTNNTGGTISNINIANGTLNLSGEGNTGAVSGNIANSNINIVNTFASGGDITGFLALTIKDNAILNLNNDVTATTLIVGEGVSGKLNVGGNNLTLTGALTSAAGATFKTTINSAAQDDAGSLTVTGASTIDNSLTVDVLTGAVALVDGTTYAVINSGSGTTDTITNITDDNAGFDFTATLNAGDLVLTANAFTGALVINDGETLSSSVNSNFTSVTVGGGASGILNHTAGAITTGTVTINTGATYTQTGTAALNAADISLANGVTLTLLNQGTGTIDGAAAQQGDLIFAGDYNTDAAIGDTNSLSSVTVNDGVTLTVDQNFEANAVNVGEGVSGILNQSAGTLATATLTINNGASYTQSGTGVLNASNISIGTGNTLTLVNQGTGAIDGLAAGVGKLVFAGDYNTDAAIGATNALALVIINSGATLTLDQALSSSSFTVNSGATLDVGGSSVNVTGNFDLSAGATFKTTINSGTANDAGSLVVSGTATVSGDANIVVLVSANAVIADGTTYTIIDAGAGSITAPTSIIDDSDELNFTASVNAGDLILTAALETPLAPPPAPPPVDEDPIGEEFVAELSDNATAVFAVLDDLTSNDPELAAAFAGVTTAEEFDQVLNSLTPDVSSAIVKVTASAGKSAVVTVFNRLSALRTSGVFGNMSGLAAGDTVADVGVWLQGFGAIIDQNDRQGILGFEADTKGFSLGGDKQLNDNWLMGAAFSFSATDVNSNSTLGGGTDIDSYQGTIYASFQRDQNFLDASFSYANNDYEGKRRIAVGGLNRTADSDYGADQFIFSGTFGRQFKLTESIYLVPSVGVQYVNLDVDGYTETGAGTLNLVVAGQTHETLESVLGVSLRKEIQSTSGYTIMPEVHLNWRHDFKDEIQSNTSTFTGGGASFVTNGFDPVSDSANFGVSFLMYSESNFEFKAGYDLEKKADYTGHSGSLTIRYNY